jgi:methyl-accepting chemotaxis protein
MLKKMKLHRKILGSIALTLLLTSAVSFWITQRRVNQQAEEAFRDKVRQITGMAGATRSWFSDNIETLVPGKNFKSLNQVPVVVAWSVARQYATAQNMEFHTPSLTPRNPKNQPDEFERRALQAFQQDSSLGEYSDRTVENGQDIMRYAQAIRLTEDCLLCHGDPAGAKDPFGYIKEGMKAGDLRGAFTVRASTEGLVQTARSNSIALFFTTFLTLLAAAGVLFVLVRKLITRPLSSAVDMANKIAGNNLAMEDLPVESEDEIGDATTVLNTMKNNLRCLLQSIAETAEQVAAASEELSATSQQITANSEETTAQAHVRCRWPSQYQPAIRGLRGRGNECHDRRDCQERDRGGASGGRGGRSCRLGESDGVATGGIERRDREGDRGDHIDRATDEPAGVERDH